MKIYIMIGLMGSGKSSWARMMAGADFNVIRVSGDAIRSMIKQSYVFDSQLEPLVAKMQLALIQEAILAGKDVVVDDCNLTRKGRGNLCTTIFSIVGQKEESIEIIYVWMKCARDIALDRRLANLRGKPKFTWKFVMQLQEGMFDCPEKDENMYVSDIIEVDNK